MTSSNADVTDALSKNEALFFDPSTGELSTKKTKDRQVHTSMAAKGYFGVCFWSPAMANHEKEHVFSLEFPLGGSHVPAIWAVCCGFALVGHSNAMPDSVHFWISEYSPKSNSWTPQCQELLRTVPFAGYRWQCFINRSISHLRVVSEIKMLT